MKIAHTITVLFMILPGRAAHFASAVEPSARLFKPAIPRIYDDAETARWRVPLALA